MSSWNDLLQCDHRSGRLMFPDPWLSSCPTDCCLLWAECKWRVAATCTKTVATAANTKWVGGEVVETGIQAAIPSAYKQRSISRALLCSCWGQEVVIGFCNKLGLRYYFVWTGDDYRVEITWSEKLVSGIRFNFHPDRTMSWIIECSIEMLVSGWVIHSGGWLKHGYD